MSNNKKIIILLIFVISLLTFTSLFTISRYNLKKTLTGNINSKVIKIEFEPNGNNTYQASQSTTVTVTHKASTNFRVLKYVWSATEVDASEGTSFTSGDTITKSAGEGQLYLCIYAEDINGLHNNVCSNKFYVDAKAPTMNITTEETATATYIVVEVEENGSGLKSVVNNEGLTVDHIDNNKYYFIALNSSTYSFTATDNIDQVTTKSYTACNNLIGNITNFDYTGDVQEFIAACPGKYRLETWGAQGGSYGNYNGGYGGYSVGKVELVQNQKIYIGIGGTTSSKNGGYNGGGNATDTQYSFSYFAGGGGATHIAFSSGLLSKLEKEENNLLIIAGGGSGVYYFNDEYIVAGASGGGYVGNDGYVYRSSCAISTESPATGGTQESGGIGNYGFTANSGSFGQGGNGSNSGVGGGGGYYGGGGTDNWAGCTAESGGGGSGYIGNPNLIDKYMYCYNCQTSTEINTRTLSDGENSCHSETPTTSCAKEGNGYARITYLGDDEYHVILLNSDDFDLHGTSTISGKYFNDLPSIVTPTKAGYTFTGYYDNQTAFDMEYSNPTTSSTNVRIDFVNIASNGWNMTSADAGTHINAKIIVNKIEIPTIEFNDRKIVPYKVEIDNNKTILYLDFDITSEMVTNTNYNYETSYRFIDLEFNSNTSFSDITIDHITKNGIKYYDEDGESVFPYNKDIRILYAHKTIVNYTIGYTLNGGTVATPNPIAYNAETNTFTLTNPTRSNYTFVGWSGTGLTGNNNTTVTIAKGSTGNRTYTANWTPTNYTIGYTLNGGSASNPTSYNIETNSFTLNNPTRTGYNFSGWTGTGLSSASTSVTIAKGSSGNRTYTANWTPTNYTIGYTLNGGSASNPTSYNIETNNFTLNNPTRTGYNFSGWTGTGLSSASTSVTIAKGSTGNRSYTANWSAKSIKCNAGYYLPANSESCARCEAGNYCPGGTWTYNGSLKGRGQCPAGSYSGAGASACTACQGSTSGAGSSSCPNSCGKSNVASWNTATWNSSNNTVSNVCSIKTCASGYTLSNNTCSDTTTPTITVKSGQYDFNDTSSVYTASFGGSGGSVSCKNTSNSNAAVTTIKSIGIVGKNTITCTATGNNGKTATASNTISVYYSALGKNLGVTGGSYVSGNNAIVPYGGWQYGPYIKMQKGTYQIHYTGSNLNSVYYTNGSPANGYDSAYNNNGTVYYNTISNFMTASVETYYRITTSGLISNCEFRIFNTTNNNITVSKLEIIPL